MTTPPRSVAEWRSRWESPTPPPTKRPRDPRSPWVYLLASFGGTVLALCICLALGIGVLVAIADRNGSLDGTPESLTYVNDTDGDLLVYECIDRCNDYNYAFWLDAGDQESFRLSWYDDDPVDWVVVIREDQRYGCIPIPDWTDQTIDLSTAQPCPPDIHSPESNQA